MLGRTPLICIICYYFLMPVATGLMTVDHAPKLCREYRPHSLQMRCSRKDAAVQKALLDLLGDDNEAAVLLLVVAGGKGDETVSERGIHPGII